MADPSKAELGAALARVLGSGAVSLAPGASAEERKRVQAELEFRAGVRTTRPEPEPKPESDDADHERRMVERSIAALRARADAAEAEAVEAYLADQPHRESELRAEAERLRATAARHENTLRVQARGKGDR